MSNWNSVYNLLPADGETVWIRPNGFFDDPFQAVFSLSSQNFTSVDTGVIVPVWNVYRWTVVV
jgi:hypothetical protein